jgi:ATP-dependent RNA helicase RhlE
VTEVISASPTFASLGLAEQLLAALAGSGYTTPTSIQAQAIPPLLAGKDVLGLAETGSGKTAAFALPILQALSKIKDPVAPRTCRALILAPTRELAIQIGESFETYGKQFHLRHTVIFGGVGSRPQIRAMDRGVDILIATPGRLLDLMGTKNVNLSRVQFFVLDEADRMLDMGFIRDVKRITKELPKVRQSLLFSATMPQDITSLANEILHHPVRVEVARAGKTVDRIEQFVYHVDTKSKRGVLAALLKDDAMSRVILFTRTKHGADRVARGLGASGVGAFAIHGNKSQNARQAALESFRTGKARVLVATDIAARGIDIDDITHVVNYDIPNIPESYVHRIGRTARAGKTGVAIALCAPEERAFLRDIERLTRKPLTPGAAIVGLAEVTASLPPIPNKGGGDDRDDDSTFERGRGRIAGRRHVPHARPATAWRDTDPARPAEAGAHAASNARTRDDRGAPRRDSDRRGNSRDGERRGPPKTDHSVGDRAPSDRPRSDAPRAPRTHGSHGDRPFAKGPGAPRSDRPFQARDGERRGPSADGERRPPPRDGGRDNHRSSAPRSTSAPRGEGRPFQGRSDAPRSGEAPRGDRGADRGGDRGRPPERREGAGRDFKRPDRSNDRGGDRGADRGERTRDPVISSSKPWENKSGENKSGENRPSATHESRPQNARPDNAGAPRTAAPRSDDRSPGGGRPEGRRPESRGPDGRPANRWSAGSGSRPRGGDQPRRAGDAGRTKTD